MSCAKAKELITNGSKAVARRVTIIRLCGAVAEILMSSVFVVVRVLPL